MATLDRPGFFQRIGIAFRSFFRLLGNGDFARKVVELESLHSESQEAKPPAVPLKPESSEVPKPSIHPLQLIGILQREGRLLDFLMEEIENLPDAQIGAAVREVHKKSAKALRDHVTLASVVETLEDEKMTVASGYDPS
ncbi:MAG TPA: DUF2760 domain-containing protein, partial [Gemmatales bacterium]|nr:DUF2760 domain-containing protein [Gemmatales bacterium]